MFDNTGVSGAIFEWSRRFGSKRECAASEFPHVRYSVFKERKAGEGARPGPALIFRLCEKAIGEVKEKITVTLRWCFP